MHHLNRVLFFVLAFSLHPNCQSQILRFATDSFHLAGSVDSIWLYNQLVDTTKAHPTYRGKGYYTYTQSKNVQSIFQVYVKDTLGFVIEFFPDGSLAGYYHYRGHLREGMSYYFDLGGNLIRIGIRDRGQEIGYYLIEKNRKVLFVNHLAKHGTKRKKCFRRLNKEEMAFIQELNSQIDSLKIDY